MSKSPTIYIVEDDELLTLVLSQGFRKEDYEVITDPGTGAVARRIEEKKPDLLLLDVNLPDNSGIEILEDVKSRELGMPVIMLTADDTAETAVTALKLGAYDYITKPFEMDKLKIVVRNAIESIELKRTVKQYRDDALQTSIIGETPVMKHLVEDIRKIAAQRVMNLLILGESGTGKELVARAIHTASPASFKPFVAVNCAALPHGLLESELFGYEKGAFTDAKTMKKGLFEEATGGTLVLDEIGDMDISLQSKLLRVLESRAVRRLGGVREISFDVMVIATTNRDLMKLQKEGLFRQDLYFRLSMFSLKLPSLRERRDDIPLLAEHFFSQCKKEFGKDKMSLSQDAIRALQQYDWPGNVRELKSLFAKVCLLEEAEVIEPDHLLKRLDVVHDEPVAASSAPEVGTSLYDIEKRLIQETLSKVNGNMTKAAKMLNISYDTLRYRMKKFDIK